MTCVSPTCLRGLVGDHYAAIRDVSASILGVFRFRNEVNCVCSFDVVYALGQPPQLVGQRTHPTLSQFGTLDEVPIFKFVARLFVKDGAYKVCVVGLFI